MTEKSSPDYLRILEEVLTERRASKERIAEEYRKVDEAFSLNEEIIDSVQAQYQPTEDVLEPLKVQREELNKNIRERKNQIPKLEKELERLRAETEKFENEVEPIRKEITFLMKQSKPIRDRLDDLWRKYFQLEKQRDELRQRSKESERAFSEANRQYWLALQWEKKKPLIIVAGLVLLFVVVLVAFVWAATQLPLYGLIPVIIVTFLVFVVIVITLLRQDEKLKEESFTQIVRDIIQQVRSIRQ
jgi:chromosome segregation ATPase